MEKQKIEYLGDGVYAIAENDGIMLHANDHHNPSDRIFIEPSVMTGLIKFQIDIIKKNGGDAEAWLKSIFS